MIDLKNQIDSLNSKLIEKFPRTFSPLLSFVAKLLRTLFPFRDLGGQYFF